MIAGSKRVLGKGLEKSRVEEVIPATVYEEVEAVDRDQVRQRVLVEHSAQRSHLH